MLSKIRNAASLKGGDPISSEIYLDLVTKTASEFSLSVTTSYCLAVAADDLRTWQEHMQTICIYF